MPQGGEADVAAVLEGVRPVLGVNLYPDPHPAPVEVATDAPEAGVSASRLAGPDSQCTPLRPARLAEAAEQGA